VIDVIRDAAFADRSTLINEYLRGHAGELQSLAHKNRFKLAC
jgi:hypothetical protein